MPELPDATALLEDFAGGALSPLEALDATLERIARRTPRSTRSASSTPTALGEAAARSQARWSRGEPAGLLDGVPVAIKDVLLTARMADAARLAGRRSRPGWDVDAPSVAALARNGAVAVGKTTTPEFGWKGVTDGPLDGVTRNPWDVTRTAGGSSGGSSARARRRDGAARPRHRRRRLDPDPVRLLRARPGSSRRTAACPRGRRARSASSPTSGRWRGRCATWRCCSTSSPSPTCATGRRWSRRRRRYRDGLGGGVEGLRDRLQPGARLRGRRAGGGGDRRARGGAPGGLGRARGGGRSRLRRPARDVRDAVVRRRGARRRGPRRPPPTDVLDPGLRADRGQGSADHGAGVPAARCRRATRSACA